MQDQSFWEQRWVGLGEHVMHWVFTVLFRRDDKKKLILILHFPCTRYCSSTWHTIARFITSYFTEGSFDGLRWEKTFDGFPWWENSGRLNNCTGTQLVNGRVRIRMQSTSSNTLATWCKELTHWKRPWGWERLKARGEGDDRGWDRWLESPTLWTWVWVSSRSWWWAGKPGGLQSMGSQRVRHDWVTELNWTSWSQDLWS